MLKVVTGFGETNHSYAFRKKAESHPVLAVVNAFLVVDIELCINEVCKKILTVEVDQATERLQVGFGPEWQV